MKRASDTSPVVNSFMSQSHAAIVHAIAPALAPPKRAPDRSKRCCSAATQPACHQKNMPPPGNMREGEGGWEGCERGGRRIREAAQAAAAANDVERRMSWDV